jgi:hypothetical protein
MSEDDIENIMVGIKEIKKEKEEKIDKLLKKLEEIEKYIVIFVKKM